MLSAPNSGAIINQRSKALLASIRQNWEAVRSQAARLVNAVLVRANWLIGEQIVEAEQGGKSRATYNRCLLKTLSSALEKEYGSGFSISFLQYMRAFFLGYLDLLEIQHAVPVELDREEGSTKQHALRVNLPEMSENTWLPGHLHPALAWTHY